MAEEARVKRVNVDEILIKITGSRGIWQVAVLLITIFSLTTPTLFPIYANSVPRFRCAADNATETILANTLIPTDDGGTRHLTFDEAARRIGPWFSIKESDTNNQGRFGCSRYKNLPAINEPTPQNLQTEPCLNGYVYQSLETQYPDTIVAEWDLVCDDAWKAPFSTSIYMLGLVVGFLFGGPLGSHFGRKKVIYFSGVLECAFGLAVTFAPNYEVYAVLRFLLSTSRTMKVACVAVLTAEMTTGKYRAMVSATFSIALSFLQRTIHAGIAMHLPQWRYLHLVIMIPAFIGLLTLPWIPESPRWLVSQGKEIEALKILFKGHKFNSIYKSRSRLSEDKFLEQAVVATLPEPDAPESKEKVKFTLRLKNVLLALVAPYQNFSLARRSLICTILYAGQVLTFFGVLLYANITRHTVYYVSMINGAMSIPGTVLSSILYVNIRGRKKPLLAIYGISAVTLLIGSIYAVVAKPSTDIALIVCANIGLVLLTASFDMLFIYVTELFPSSIRTQGYGNAAGIGRTGAVLSSFVNQLDVKLGHGVPMIVYGAVVVLLFVLLCFLPDTDGENLADVVEEEKF